MRVNVLIKAARNLVQILKSKSHGLVYRAVHVDETLSVSFVKLGGLWVH